MSLLNLCFSLTFTAVDCGRIGAPDDGEITLSQTTFGSEATYECDEGFELVGNVTRTCEANGEWSGEEPACNGKILWCDTFNLCASVDMLLNFRSAENKENSAPRINSFKQLSFLIALIAATIYYV